MHAERLRRAAARTVRQNAEVALLCEYAQAAADYIESLGWQPIETVPSDIGIDVWLGSLDNPDFGARVTSVHRTGNRWFGLPDYYNTDRVKPTYWMRPPVAPNDVVSGGEK